MDRPHDVVPTKRAGGTVAAVVALCLVLLAVTAGVSLLWRDPDDRSVATTTSSTTTPAGPGEQSSHGDHAGPDQDSAEGDAGEKPRSGPDTRSAGRASLKACRQLLDRQRDVLGAAQASLGQWRLHIRAMNDLVAGRITLQQATAFWDRTRVGAHRKVERFQRVDRGLGRARGSCVVPGWDASPRIREAVTGCLAATLKQAPRVSVARVAVATWLHHIHDMEALRRGEITPQQAVDAWARSWRRGAEQLRVYDARTAEAASYDCRGV